METSAKTGFNAENLFIKAGKVLYSEYLKYKKAPKISGNYLKKRKERKKEKKILLNIL